MLVTPKRHRRPAHEGANKDDGAYKNARQGKELSRSPERFSPMGWGAYYKWWWIYFP